MAQEVSTAYFFADATRRVFVETPDEGWEPGDEGTCAFLLKNKYDTRDAALNRAKCYADELLELGFTKDASSPCVLSMRGVKSKNK